jgi:hypothetical protein
MNNSYDEIKKLLKSSRQMIGSDRELNQIKESLINKNILVEQPMDGPGYEGDTNNMGQTRPNVAADIEQEIQMDTKPKEDKQQAYRISGGVLVMHGKNKGDLEITTDEKRSFQETMDEFVDEVSEMVDFYPINIYPTSVEWSGKVIDQDLEFFFSIGENNGVYINGNMIKVDDDFMDFVTKLKAYYMKFKTKWAKVLATRKKTGTDDNQ